MRRHLFLLLLLAGCASEHGPSSQPGKSAKEIIRFGVVESVTPIQMDNSSNGGGAVGSVFGQVGGASSGGGRGAVVGSILGNVLGGTLGQQAGVATQPGLELWIRFDDEDKSTYVMQPGLPASFKPGDHVRIIRKNGEFRVEPTAPPGTLQMPD